MEAGKYYISFGLDDENNEVPLDWKRADDGNSYYRLSPEQEQAEKAMHDARSAEFIARAKEHPATQAIGELALARLFDDRGDLEAVVIGDDNFNTSLTYTPLEWAAFRQSAHEAYFDDLAE